MTLLYIKIANCIRWLIYALADTYDFISFKLLIYMTNDIDIIDVRIRV